MIKKRNPLVKSSLLVILVSLIPISGNSISSAADPSYVPNYSPVEIDYPGTNVVFHVGETYPSFKSDLSNYDTQAGKTISCRSTEDSDCSFDSKNTGFAMSILPPCSDETASNCIVGLDIKLPNKSEQTAKLVKEIGGYTIPADSAKGYIGGRSASLWTLSPGDSVTATISQIKYLVAAKLESPWDAEKLKFGAQKLSVSVFPIVEKAGDFNPDRWATDAERSAYENTQFKGVPLKFIPKVMQGSSANDLRECMFFDDKYCGQHTIYEDETRVKVELRLTNEIGGWFHGRIKDPVISIKEINATSNLVTVDAEAITIPRLTHVVDHNALDTTEKKLFDQTFWGGAVPRELLAGPLADSGETGFTFLNALREKVGDAAAGSTSAWNFTSINAGGGSTCLSQKGKVLGIVSTNATVFESTAPKFYDGQLAYKVSGLHYQKDKKTENLGTYDLVINSEVARCLYGFTKAPISASVSITGGSDAKIATTVVNEKNGWLKLAAYGFTFSEKVLQVKLSQAAVVEPTPTATATSRPTAKRITITCVKGKSVKKVTAVKPTCPSGYKKKA